MGSWRVVKRIYFNGKLIFAVSLKQNRGYNEHFLWKEPKNPHPDPLQRRGRRDTKRICRAMLSIIALNKDVPFEMLPYI